MQYLNSAAEPAREVPPREYHLDTPLKDYDLNFCFPVQILESNGVRLEPLIPSKHAKALFLLLRQDPYIYRYLSVAPETLAELCTFYEMTFRRDPAYVPFVIYDKTYDPPRIAGTLAYSNASATHLKLEIGNVTILSHYQRSHVNTHACALLIKYALEPKPTGLGLRRVWWFCHSANEPSRKAAERLGFRFEGISRWDRVLEPDKEGVDIRNDRGLGQPGSGAGRHTCVLSLTWEDWRDGADHNTEQLMARPLPLR